MLLLIEATPMGSSDQEAVARTLESLAQALRARGIAWWKLRWRWIAPASS